MNTMKLKPVKLASGVILTVLGALMMADAVVFTVTGAAPFFPGVAAGFEFAVGVLAVAAATPTLQDSRA
jgi:hypothetical protein